MLFYFKKIKIKPSRNKVFVQMFGLLSFTHADQKVIAQPEHKQPGAEIQAVISALHLLPPCHRALILGSMLSMQRPKSQELKPEFLQKMKKK